MADKTNKDLLLNIDGKQVPLSQVNKPHYAVIGGTEKAIPNLENFPPLEPLALDDKKKTEPAPEK